MAPTVPAHNRRSTAIIGMSCRLPAGASSPSRLWDVLVNKQSGQSQLPTSRFNAQAFHNPDPNKTGTINSLGGYFLQHDIHQFDNAFFGINNLEAKYMDPQQRQLLEVVYECFESAGSTLDTISGANIGCYIANFTSDYVTMQAKSPELYHRYSATGFGPTILANRISHCFNLTGPSVVLDTACSSSLYALHVACAAIGAGECEGAIVAGANLVQTPETFIAMAKAGVLSSTSTSHTFDTSADGYGRGEGVAALYLKRMDVAIVNGDPVRSIIRGSAVNSNGRTPGITLPSVVGQEAVIRKAYASANLSMDDTIYVEAHGTGTPVGDPIEVEALARAMNPKSDKPLYIGSIKTNIGHGEAVSGIASVIKAVLALEHQMIPPTIGINKLNPTLKLTERNIRIVTELQAWPKDAEQRMSINSFGYGGANAHVIIDSAASCISVIRDKLQMNALRVHRTLVLPLSAATSQSLLNNLEAYASFATTNGGLEDIAYTLASRRTSLSTRSYLLATDTTEAGRQPQITIPQIQSSEVVPVPLPFAFICTGQGAQWPKMGCELLQRFPLYAKTIDNLDTYLAALQEAPTWSIKETINADSDTSSIHEAIRSQPICTAIQIALVDLLRSWGIKAEAVVGHSSGEICAAYAAGFITAEIAIAVAYYRGLAVSKMSEKGAMVAVGLGSADVDDHIQRLGLQDQLRVACINSPESSTVSGGVQAIDNLLVAFQQCGIFARKLKTDDKAYHSHMMTSVGHTYQKLLDPIFAAQQPVSDVGNCVLMHSSVTASVPTAELIAVPLYWRTNLESPVLFSKAVQNLLSKGPYHLIEIGPHPALGQPVHDIQKLQPSTLQSKYSSTLTRGKDSEKAILNLVGTLYTHGHDLPFAEINDVYAAVPKLGTTSKTPSTDTNGYVNGYGCKGDKTIIQETVHEDILDESGLTNGYSHGSQVPKYQRPYSNARVSPNMPGYSWHYQKSLWNESRTSKEYRSLTHKRHDLLGSRVPGSPGIGVWWHNNLKMQEISWLSDHKLGPTTVFPAAAYLAMALEGLSQLRNFTPSTMVSFQNVHLLNMLVLHDNGDGIEVNMQMKPAELSNTTASSLWWWFEISSHTEKSDIVHANGYVNSKENVEAVARKFDCSDITLEEQMSRTWYNKLAQEGLCFGPQFKSLIEISTDRYRKHARATAKISFRRGDESSNLESFYAIHPTTLDSLLQCAIIASTSGVTSQLRGKVPVSIGKLAIIPNNTIRSFEACSIRGSARKVGFETVMLGGELESSKGQIIAQMEDVRAIAYKELALQSKTTLERNPALRILWKPDLSTLSSSDTRAISEYLESFTQLTTNQTTRSSLPYLAGALDLATHCYGRARILEIVDDRGHGSDLKEFLERFDIGSGQKHFDTYTQAMISSEGVQAITEKTLLEITEPASHSSRTHDLGPNTIFDIIIISSLHLVPDIITNQFDKIAAHLAPAAYVILATDVKKDIQFRHEDFSLVSATPSSHDTSYTIARYQKPSVSSINTGIPRIVLVHDDGGHPLNHELRKRLFDHFQVDVLWLSLSDASTGTIPHGSIVVTTIEFEKPVLAGAVQSHWPALQSLAEYSSILLWVTGGTLYKAQRPEFALVLGLARSLMLERPSLRMPVLDINTSMTDIAVSCNHIISVLTQVSQLERPDLEYRQYNNILYSSRFVPDVALNKRFREVRNGEQVWTKIADAGNCKLAINHVGQLDTLHFQEQSSAAQIAAGWLEIQVKFVGLNAKDYYALNDKVDIREATCALEFTGIVSRVGSNVSAFACGDRVLVMAPNHFGTYEVVPEWACCKLEDGEDMAEMSSLPLVFSSALYALEDRAQLRKHQSVLIHSATGGVGLAAIQVAKRIGAEIYATVGTLEKKKFLTQQWGIKESHIFDSHASFLAQLLEVTSNRAVDVVLNSLTGDLLHESWQACDEFATFVEIGKKDIVDSGKLDMTVFKRGTTFTAFDLTDLYWSKSEHNNHTWHSLLHRSVSLLRNRQIDTISPLKVFPASNIVDAFRYFSLATRIGKVVVSFEESENMLVVPSKFHSTFDVNKAYLLIGCLGGLGRSIARWMLNRGARHFIFIGRSGTDKKAAQALIKDLEQANATSVVIRGDVSDYSDVEKAVSASTRPIGGVVQAAMSIHVALFGEMTCEAWRSGIDQKVKGAWNLHNALKGHDDQLDFFLMLSSITGSVGTATESNYCAANSFLDAFGSYRRSQDLPGISLGLGMISEVGFLHENPETEAALLRKGVHPFTEEELLEIIDITLSPPPKDTSSVVTDSMGSDHYINGHILTGLELHGFQKIRDSGFTRGAAVLEDPRCAYIAGAFADSAQDNNHANDAGGRSYPTAVAAALTSNESTVTPDADLVDAVRAIVVDRIATLLLVPAKQLQANALLADFGMESMLAAEFRADMFRAFKVDVPFGLLLDKMTRVRGVAELIGKGLLTQREQGKSG